MKKKIFFFNWKRKIKELKKKELKASQPVLCQFQSLAVLKVDHSQNMTGICFLFLNSPVNVKLFSYFTQYILLYAMLFVFDLKEMK